LIIRRLGALAILVVIVAGFAFGAHSLSGGNSTKSAAGEPDVKTAAAAKQTARAVPREMRGVHVTMALASLHGKLEEYLALKRAGLNTIELDVKDENGEIGSSSAPPFRTSHRRREAVLQRPCRPCGGARRGPLPDRPGRHVPDPLVSERRRARLHNATAPSGTTSGADAQSLRSPGLEPRPRGRESRAGLV
jgi:hypothetical protein